MSFNTVFRVIVYLPSIVCTDTMDCCDESVQVFFVSADLQYSKPHTAAAAVYGLFCSYAFGYDCSEHDRWTSSFLLFTSTMKNCFPQAQSVV